MMQEGPLTVSIPACDAIGSRLAELGADRVTPYLSGSGDTRFVKRVRLGAGFAGRIHGVEACA